MARPTADEPRVVNFHPRAAQDDTKSPWKEFFVPPVGDARGRLAGRCDATMEEHVMMLVQNPDTPFRNMSEFLRFAVDVAVVTVNEKLRDPRLADSIAKRRIILDVLKDEEEGKQVMEMGARLKIMIDGMLREGDVEAARQQLEMVRNTAMSMRSPRWRRKTLELVKKYAAVMK